MKFAKNGLVINGLLLITLTLSACNDNSSQNPSPNPTLTISIASNYMAISQGATRNLFFTVTNDSNNTLQNLSVTLPQNFNFSNASTCSQTAFNLAAHASCNLVINYKAPSINGGSLTGNPQLVNATLTISGEASASQMVNISVFPAFYSLPQNANASFSYDQIPIQFLKSYQNGNTDIIPTQSGVYVSHDSGKTFAAKTSANGLVGNAMSQGILSQNNAIVAVTDSGIAVSYDQGNTFQPVLDTGLQTVGQATIIGNTILVPTAQGLYVSKQNGQFSAAIPGVDITGLSVGLNNVAVLTADEVYRSTDQGVNYASIQFPTAMTNFGGNFYDDEPVIDSAGNFYVIGTDSANITQVYRVVNDQAIALAGATAAQGLYKGFDNNIYAYLGTANASVDSINSNGQLTPVLSLNSSDSFNSDINGPVQAGSNTYIATTNNVYYSNNGLNFNPVNGVTGTPIKIFGVPNQGIVYIETQDNNGNYQIYKSADGIHFEEDSFLSGLPVQAMAFHGQEIYAAVALNPVVGNPAAGLYISTNGGMSYQHALIGIPVSTLNATDMGINIGTLQTTGFGFVAFGNPNNVQFYTITSPAPSGRDVIVKGGLIYFGTPAGLYTSSNGGEDFNLVNQTGLGSTGIRKMLFVNNALYVGLDGITYGDKGGVAVLLPGAVQFTQKILSFTNRVFGLAAASDGTIYAAGISSENLQGGVAAAYPDVSSPLFNGSSYTLATMDINNNSYLFFGNNSNLYESVNGGTPTPILTAQGTIYSSYADGETLYVGASKLYKGTYNGSWSFTQLGSSVFGNSRIQAIYAKDNFIGVGTVDDGLYISTDGGNSFSHYTTANGLGSNSINGISIQGNELYIACSNGGLVVWDLPDSAPSS